MNININTNTFSVDEALEELTQHAKGINSTINRISIVDAEYSKEFIEDVKNALITVAVIKALGISGRTERYLEAVLELLKLEIKFMCGINNRESTP